MKTRILSKSVLALAAIACGSIPAASLIAQNTSPKQRQVVTTYKVPLQQRQIFTPRPRTNIRIAPNAVANRTNTAPVVDRNNSGRLARPTIRNAFPNNTQVMPVRNNQFGVGNNPVPSNGQSASLISTSGAIGNRIGIAVQPNLSSPVFLIFSTGGIVPANITSRVLTDNRGFYTPVPAQLCFNNVQNWVAKLQLADGTLIDPVGRFARPFNCP